MSPPRKYIAPEVMAEAKRLYEQTMTPTHDIAAMMGISRSTFNNRVSDWDWVRRGVNNPAVNIARVVRGSAVASLTASAGAEAAQGGSPGEAITAVAPTDRAALAARIQHVVEREMDAVERVLDKLGPTSEAEAERSTRTLANVARTLREIVALMKPDEVTPPNDADDDPIPRDIDEFRHELARRINALVDAEREREREGAGGGGDELA